MQTKKAKASRAVLIRYIITNILILIIPFITATAYYIVSTNSIEASVNNIADLQLSRDVNYVDQKLKDLEEQVSQLLVDYELNRYLNETPVVDDIDLYNTKRISSRLASIVIGGEFLSRAYIYLAKSDIVVLDNGFSPFGSFYGPLFETEGISASQWKSVLTDENSLPKYVLTGFRSSEGAKFHTSHFYVNHIGSGSFFRGTFVAVINADLLGRFLTKLPELYGGWLLVQDMQGGVVACSSSNNERKLNELIKGANSSEVIDIDGQLYRVYSQTSGYNGWSYFALLNDKLIHNDLIAVRNTAFFLLSIGFFLGLLVAYILAFSNSKPVMSLVSLLKVNPSGSFFRFSAVSASLEDAIKNLSKSKNELEQEIASTTNTAKAYFLQNLLRGEYHDRVLFTEDRDRFRLVLPSSPYFVIVCRLSPLATALETPDYSTVKTALLQKFQENILSDEYAIRIPSGALAVILRLESTENSKTIARAFITNSISEIKASLQEHVLFGIGSPVNDPFLLPLSFNEAEAANLAIGPEQRSPVCFYDELSAADFMYSYPLQLEEAICRAIRGANGELLGSLLDVLRNENFKERILSSQEAENLVLALRVTAGRMINEFPLEFKEYQVQINRIIDIHVPEQAFTEITKVLTGMAESRDKGKKSRNQKQVQEIKEYIHATFRDFNLGLTSISERFNLSENYISNFFKENEGEGLANYIQRIRMSEATSILATIPDIPVYKVALNCGYPNSSTFRRAFKRVNGLTPSEYRSESIKLRGSS